MKELYLKEIIERINEDGYIYTPLNLCRDMLSSISTFDGKNILVIRNIEFIYCLYEMGIDMSNVYYTVNCELKRNVAISLGLDINKIYNLEYKSKEVNFNTEMKFDVIVQNPPYNPNSLWKKFVEKAIDQLEDDGQMVAIHPISWRESSRNKKLCEHLKKYLKELHIMDYTAFPDITIKTDWYLYNKSGSDITNITYSNGDTENVDLKSIERILRFSTKSIPYSILQKITKRNYDNGMILKKGWEKINYITPDKAKVKKYYKLCGGKGNGTGWTKGKFSYTKDPCSNQFGAKVVMSYVGKPRAHYFNDAEQIGVISGYYWLTNNKSLPILLNSKMFWKIVGIEIAYWHAGDPTSLDLNIIRSLNFENLDVETEEELYEHYNLTEEEINWIEND